MLKANEVAVFSRCRAKPHRGGGAVAFCPPIAGSAHATDCTHVERLFHTNNNELCKSAKYQNHEIECNLEIVGRTVANQVIYFRGRIMSIRVT